LKVWEPRSRRRSLGRRKRVSPFVLTHIYYFENIMGFDMDPSIREYIKKHIDKFLNEEKLSKKVSLFKEYQKIGLVSSIEDALYGALIESLYDITIVLNVFEGHSLSSEEMEELLEIVRNKSLKIKSKVSKALTL
jgi:hypothetical protein